MNPNPLHSYTDNLSPNYEGLKEIKFEGLLWQTE